MSKSAHIKSLKPAQAKTKLLSDFRQQVKNANKHTEHGMAMLETSMQSVGYTAPMIAAADHEIISGSARHETAANVFGSDAKPIIVESDGTRPVVVIRTDIANAGEEKAKRIALLENRVSEINLSWDAPVLAEMRIENPELLGEMFSENELTEMFVEAGLEQEPLKDAEAQIDRAAELNKVWQVKTGDLFGLGKFVYCPKCKKEHCID